MSAPNAYASRFLTPRRASSLEHLVDDRVEPDPELGARFRRPARHEVPRPLLVGELPRVRSRRIRACAASRSTALARRHLPQPPQWCVRLANKSASASGNTVAPTRSPGPSDDDNFPARNAAAVAQQRPTCFDVPNLFRVIDTDVPDNGGQLLRRGAIALTLPRAGFIDPPRHQRHRRLGQAVDLLEGRKQARSVGQGHRAGIEALTALPSDSTRVTSHSRTPKRSSVSTISSSQEGETVTFSSRQRRKGQADVAFQWHYHRGGRRRPPEHRTAACPTRLRRRGGNCRADDRRQRTRDWRRSARWPARTAPRRSPMRQPSRPRRSARCHASVHIPSSS